MKNSLSEAEAEAEAPAAAPAGAHPSTKNVVKSYVYRDCDGQDTAPERDALDGDESDETAAADPNLFLNQEQAQALVESARAETWAEARDTLWAEARKLAEQELHADLEQRLEQEQAALTEALRAFDRQREEYFRQIEREIVQMVLAITRKVLHREAQIDPLLLAGTVRVALDPLAAGTPVTLVVPPSSLSRWEEQLRREAPLTNPPQIRADAALEPSGCRLETDSGVTDLSWEFQLREIEQGFLDLLRRRTAAETSEDAARDRD